MARSREVVIKILGDSKSAEKAFKSLETSTQTTGQKLTAGAMKVSKAVALPLAAVGTASIMAAANLEESVNKTNVVFGKQAKSVLEFSETSAEGLGLSQAAALDAAGGYGAMFQALGLTRKASADMSMSLVTLASDMASLHNQDPTEMLEKIRAGMSGEMEPLKQFGIVLSETAVKEHAYAEGIARVGQELSEAEKVQSRYSLLMEQSAVAHGDFERTSDSLPNKLRTLKATLTDTAASFGEVLLPAAEKVAGVLGKVGEVLADLPAPAKTAMLAIAGIALVAGPTTTSIIKLHKAYKSLVAFMGTATAVQTLGFGLSGLSTLAGEAVLGLGKLIKTLGKLGPALFLVKQGFDYFKDAAEHGHIRAVTEQLEDFLQLGTATNLVGVAMKNFTRTLDHTAVVAESFTPTIRKMNKAVGKDARKAFEDLGKIITPTEDKMVGFAHLTNKEFDEWRTSTDDNFNAAGRAFDNLADKSKLTADRILRQLDRQIEAQVDYNRNWNTVVERAGGKADDLIKYLTDMGMDSAQIFEVLANTSDKKFNAIVKDMLKAQRVSGGVGRGIASGLDPARAKLDELLSQVHQLANDLANLPQDPKLGAPSGGSGGGGGGGGRQSGGRPPVPQGEARIPLGARIKVDLSNGTAWFERELSRAVARAQAV